MGLTASFAPASLIAGFQGPFAIQSGDLNGDGVLDLVVSEAGTTNPATIAVSFGNGNSGVGDGTFATPSHYAADNSINTIVLGDFDDDGVLDVLACNGPAGRLSFLRGASANGKSTGSFTRSRAFYSTDPQPLSLTTADFNGDGRSDAAVAAYIGNEINVLQGICRPLVPPPMATGAWALNGTPISRASGLQYAPAAVSDGQGGAFFSWSDARGADADVYAIRVGADGTPAPGWRAEGVPVCAAAADQGGSQIVSDDADGVFVAWDDQRNGTSQIFIQHVLGSGEIAPGWPPDGMAVFLGSSQFYFSIGRDGSGGVVMYWRDVRNSGFYTPCIYRMSPSGEPAAGWPAGGFVISSADASLNVSQLASDGHGGMFIAWGGNSPCGYPCPIPTQYNSIAHVTGEGRIDQPATDHAVGQFVAASLVADGPNAVIAQRGLFVEVDGERFAEDGSATWKRYITGCCTATAMAPDGLSGAIFAWDASPYGGKDIIAQHVTAAGTLAPGWDAPVCGASGDQSSPKMLSDATGGAFLCWNDDRDGSSALYATHVLGGGATAAGWDIDGNPVCTTASPSQQRIVTDGMGGAIMVWQDFRNGNGDIFAQRLVSDGPTPALVSLVSADAEPNLVRLIWYLSGATTVRVERREGSDNWTTLASGLAPDGNGRATYEDHDVEPGTRYGYRLGISAGPGTSYSPEVWVTTPASFVLALNGLIPNPSSEHLRIGFSLPTSASARVDLIDIAGRRVLSRRLISPAPGRHVVDLGSAAQVTPGIYIVRLEQGGKTLSTTASVFR